MNKKGFAPLDKNRLIVKENYLTGFTLIEVIIAAFILALVTSGLAYVFLAGKKHIIHTRSKMQVAELSRLFLAPLQMDVRQDQWATNCLGSSSGCPSTPADNVSVDAIPYRPSTVVSNVAGTSLKKVKISINWTEWSP